MFAPTCVGTIALDGGTIELRKGNLHLDNYGQMQQTSGKITARWHNGQDYQFSALAQVRNYGTWRKIGAVQANIDYTDFLNAATGVTSIESGELSLLEGSGAQASPYVQTSGTTRIHTGAHLTCPIGTGSAPEYDVDIRGGSFETFGAGTANLNAASVRFLDCNVELRKDDPHGFGKLANTAIEGKYEFAGTAHLLTKIGERATDVDVIQVANIDLTGNQTKLTVSYVSPNPPPMGLTWTFLDVATSLDGLWGQDFLPGGVSLAMNQRQLES